jgi:dimethylglycine dehydrogenase
MPGPRPRRSATGVGLIDATAFTKHLVRGPGATAFLDLVHLQQAAEGGADQPDLRADEPRYDAHRIHHRAAGENEYYLVSAGAWTAYDADFLMKSAEDFMGSGGGWVDIHDVTTQWGVFAIAGPKSRDVCARS